MIGIAKKRLLIIKTTATKIKKAKCSIFCLNATAQYVAIPFLKNTHSLTLTIMQSVLNRIP